MTMNPADAMPFSKLMGVRVTAASAQAVEGEIIVREDLCTAGGIMHGGAIMAFADALGAVGAVASLPEGAGGTTTIESKTNFVGPAPVGTTVIGETTPIHRGRRTMVWTTRITTGAASPMAGSARTRRWPASTSPTARTWTTSASVPKWTATASTTAPSTTPWAPR